MTNPGGVNLRSEASTDAPIEGVVLHGTFLTPTGNRRRDADGREWVAARGTTAEGEDREGWVAVEYLAEQSQGAMGETGRTNPTLERQGHPFGVVEPGDTMAGLSRQRGERFDTVADLNRHIIDPDLLYVGDRIYFAG